MSNTFSPKQINQKTAPSKPVMADTQVAPSDTIDTQAQITTLIKKAHKSSQMNIYLGYVAIICFLILGTLASLQTYRHSSWVYMSFHYLPYLLVAMGVPISLYHLFILYRYRLVQPMILGIILATGLGLPLFGLLAILLGKMILAYMAVFLSVIVWFCMPYLFKVSFRRYLQFVGVFTPSAHKH